MPYICLYFPTLAIDLARRAVPTAGDAPIVLIEGAGAEALVTAASPLALSRGAVPGMTAGQARQRCETARFLPGNAGACLSELERLASILRLYATDSVAIGGRDHLLLRIDGRLDPAAAARRLLAICRSWFRHEVRAGAAPSASGALAAARLARRAPVIAEGPLDLVAPWPASTNGSIRGSVAVRGEGLVALRREAFRLLVRLEALLAGRAQGFREAILEVETAGSRHTLRLRFENPAYTATGVMERLERHLQAPGLAGASHLRITLASLCPDVRQQPVPSPGHPLALPAAV